MKGAGLVPETRYTKSGRYNIAYQVVGDGPFDVLWIPGFVSNVELAWEEPRLARFLGRLAAFSRLILFDKRGTGLSDRVRSTSCPHSKSAWRTCWPSSTPSIRLGRHW